jgi:hypothetical protein
MPWVRIDDEFPHHPKVTTVGPFGVALQVAGLCYSNHFLTDGFIPYGAVRTLLDFNRLGENIGDRVEVWVELGAMNIAQRLVDAGMWEEVDGGYLIHDYGDYQPSRAEVEAERKKTRDRVAKYRNNRRSASGNEDRNGVTNGSETDAPVPPSLSLLVSDPEGFKEQTPENGTRREGKGRTPGRRPRVPRHPTDPFVTERVRQIRADQGPEAAMAYLRTVGENFGTEDKAAQLTRLEAWMANNGEAGDR